MSNIFNIKNVNAYRVIFITLILLIIVLFQIGHGKSYLSPIQKEYMLKAQAYLYNDSFNQAHYYLDSVIAIFPFDPVGYLFKGAVYLAEMTDSEDDIHSEEFFEMLETSRLLVDFQMDKNDSLKCAWMQLCLGHAAAYEALWESRYGSLTGAIKKGLQAKKHYEQGLRYDSTLYDLYGGLGMYHYWKSAKAGILRYLGIFRNDKNKGIAELYLAMDSSVISGYASRNSLIWIWLDKKEYDSVVYICDEMQKLFPYGKMFLWPKAYAYFKKEDFERSSEVYIKLRKMLEQEPGNYFNIIECDYALWQCAEELNDDKLKELITKSYRSYCDIIPTRTAKRQKSKISYLKNKITKD